MDEYGHIVISRNKLGIMPKLICFFTKSKFSHTLFTIPPICGQEMGIEAASIGVSALPFKSFYRENPTAAYKMYRFKADLTKKNQAIVNSLENLQKGYGTLELFWFAYRGINKLLGRDIKSQNNWSQAGIVCSELVSTYISDAGYPELFSEFGLGSISAQDVFEICEANPEIFELIEVKE